MNRAVSVNQGMGTVPATQPGDALQSPGHAAISLGVRFPVTELQQVWLEELWKSEFTRNHQAFLEYFAQPAHMSERANNEYYSFFRGQFHKRGCTMKDVDQCGVVGFIGRPRDVLHADGNRPAIMATVFAIDNQDEVVT